MFHDPHFNPSDHLAALLNPLDCTFAGVVLADVEMMTEDRMEEMCAMGRGCGGVCVWKGER